MNIRIPEGADDIIITLENSGHEAFVVGGCVRDSLLGLEPHDWDICTSATPDENEVRYGSHVLNKVVTIVYDLSEGLYLTDYFVPEYIEEKNDFVHYGFIIVSRNMVDAL